MLVAAALLAASSACTPKIGDKCTISTDCSQSGDRLCDTSQPGGYCTQFNCRGNTCPDKAACVLFDSSLPGCSYDDRSGRFGGRTARSFCIERCETDADCRDGSYVCADPRSGVFGGLILDNDQSQKTCLVRPLAEESDAGALATMVAPVCYPENAGLLTPIDASAPTLDAGLPPLVGADGG